MAAKKAKAAASEEWDQGEVTFITTDHNGGRSKGTQMCWNRKRFISRMDEHATSSQKDPDETKRFSFEVIG